jgi:hypothetical protein
MVLSFLLLVVGGQQLLTTARRALVKSKMLQGGPCLKKSFCSSLPDLEKRPTGHRSLLAANWIQSDQMDQMTEFRIWLRGESLSWDQSNKVFTNHAWRTLSSSRIGNRSAVLGRWEEIVGSRAALGRFETPFQVHFGPLMAYHRIA